MLAATGAHAGEIRHDWRDIHRDRVALRQDVRDHDWTAARAERRDLRTDYRDLRADRWDLRSGKARVPTMAAMLA